MRAFAVVTALALMMLVMAISGAIVATDLMNRRALATAFD